MIIAGFGDTVGSMYTFTTALMDDNYAEAAPQATKAVPLASGVLDVRGATPNAIAAQTIDKSFVLVTTPTADTAFATKVMSTFFTHSGNVGHTDIVPGSVIVYDGAGNGADDGAGALIDGLGSPRGWINYATGDYTITEDFFNDITGLGFDYIIGYTPKWADLGTALDALRTATIARGETKLWALMRDGTYRWTWAKCVQIKAPERVGQINHAPVSLKFVARTGLWYGETLHQVTASGGPLTAMTNAGNYIAPVTVRLTGVGTPCTGFNLRNGDGVNGITFAGTIAVGQTCVVDSLAYSIKNNGVGAFSNLTTVGDWYWLYLNPGNDGLYKWSTSGGTPTIVYEYYDTWVM